jgi:competence protein ComEA
MYPFYRWIYDLMGFSRSQANGFLIFLPLVMLIVLSEPLYRAWVVRHPADYSEDIKILDSLVALWPAVPSDSAVEFSRPISKKKPFNPNTASMTDFTELGLPETLAGRIISYRKKGGRYNSLADLKKIYGMDSSTLANIEPYLTFAKHAVVANEPEKRAIRPFHPEAVSKFDLNTADSVQLKNVKGIGSKLALRIIKYRDALGGFLSSDQLVEVYRLDTAVVKELKRLSYIAPDFVPLKINVNTSSEQELSRHPYFQKKEASAIVAYRFKHGKFNSLSDLAAIKVLDTASIRKIIPYLECK